jgi:hypothetical protein
VDYQVSVLVAALYGKEEDGESVADEEVAMIEEGEGKIPSIYATSTNIQDYEQDNDFEYAGHVKYF